MSAVLGKRKTRHVAPSEDEVEDAQAIFRRHFEAQFAPLPDTEAAPRIGAQRIEEADSDESDDIEDDYSDASDSGWGGVSDDEDDEDEDEDSDSAEPPSSIQIIDHSNTTKAPETMNKRELRALMSSRILDATAPSKPAPTAKHTKSKSTSTTDDPEDAPSLLAADLELHRLITESHLLTDYTTARPATSFSPSAPTTSRATALFSSGRLRQRTTDLRLEALAARSAPSRKKAMAASLFAPQKNMPMAMRKGIVSKAGAREAKRRAAAKEEGVVLERASGGGERRVRGGKKGVGGAMDRLEVGRMRGAELRLSKQDVRDIQGPKRGDDRGRKKRR